MSLRSFPESDLLWTREMGILAVRQGPIAGGILHLVQDVAHQHLFSSLELLCGHISTA